ncbi:glycoside hydrolase superfamily [Amylocarpus encephaloides]|uniref:Beta-xylanase n=1 Tax=Amylocarpus encephaloides TaxID=45428 RepID=A0A9P8CBS6_9HELO|nr:glycoside hydrolase superfamily [Amylocarpus encephaloides]
MRASSLFSAAVLLPQAFGQLGTLAKAKGLAYFGSATEIGELTDTAYKAIISDNTEFGQITPGNSQKWDTTEPTQGSFSFTNGDVITALAAKNSQLLRCHTLVWHSQLPSWVSGGTWTNATLTAVMENHITKVMEHYKGQCMHWDVVNEGFNDDGTYRTSIFYTTIGEAYIPLAFKAAAAADPAAKLYYNDYNIESSGAKSTATQRLVKSLKAQGVKIDGVGVQAHLIVGLTPSLAAQTANLEAFTALGVEVAYTELDIRHRSVPASTKQLATQANDYANTFNACLAVDACVGLTIWDWTDKYSWIPTFFPGQGQACLYNEDFTKKPAYHAVVNVLGGSASATKAAGSSYVEASS